MIRTLTTRLRTFLRGRDGSYSIELAIVAPILIWGVLATYTFVDGYRMQTLNLRATTAISDLLSRQWNPIDGDFVDGLGRAHAFLTNDAHPTSLRVTVVRWDEKANTLHLVWSRSTDGAPQPHTDGTLPDLAPHVPVLADADTAIVVETWMDYTPPFAVGLSEETFDNRLIVSPRFVPQLKFTS
ncbi:pilus assembly protein [Rhodobacteraceae bacterium CCMM004]|nr:pilus assembly protein [Rhodobacteraceae bacterium CCMM004]